MKKLSIFFASAAALLSSCNLDLEPPTVLRGDEAATIEYVRAMRLGLYTTIKGITTGAFLYYPDYHTDLFNETQYSGNRGGYFANWTINANDSDIYSLWGAYYSYLNQINYAMMKLEELYNNDTTGAYIDELELYRSEYHFFRAYTLHQLALRFCRDYEPEYAKDKDMMPGVPTPAQYNPDQNLPRGTLEDTYQFILKDIEAASELRSVQGSSDAIYLTADALTAFQAQVALQMHKYDEAGFYASSLISSGRYPLIQFDHNDPADRENAIAELEKMWREDISTETIFQPEVKTSTSLGTVGSMADYYNGGWSADDYGNGGIMRCQPAYIPTGTVVDAFTKDGDQDIRNGLYINWENVYYYGSNIQGYLLNKFIGNKNFQTVSTTYLYMNMPKVFRIAEMYLIDAEAKYRTGDEAGANRSLNALRTSRGLEEVNFAGTALFEEIKDERMREMIGEGHRLTDLKRWHTDKTGFGVAFTTRTYQETNLQNIVKVSSIVDITEKSYKYVFPIPSDEISNNKAMTEFDQNTGYN